MKRFAAAFVLGTSLLVPALAQEPAGHAEHGAAVVKAAAAAVAVVHPLGKSSVQGIVRFKTVGDGVEITAELEGLPPNTVHGFHIHDFGDCSAPDGSSAGGHYNPEGHPHAGPEAELHHAGDLGNITSDEQGKARLSLRVTDISISGEKNPILGRSVIVHEKPDDLKSQPVGNAGARIGCGVIGLAKSD